MSKKKITKVSLPRSLQRMFPNVTTCVDSRDAVTVSVERKDVTAARRMESDSCAMAKALCREKNVDGAVVGMSYSYLITGNKATRFKTPETVAREIVSFDRNNDFEPGDYQLSAVSPCQRLDAPRKNRSEASLKSGPNGGNASRQGKIVHKQTMRVRSMRGAEA